jgi:hypothetical protein
LVEGNIFIQRIIDIEEYAIRERITNSDDKLIDQIEYINIILNTKREMTNEAQEITLEELCPTM